MRLAYILLYVLCLIANPIFGEELDSSQLVKAELIQEESTVKPGRVFWMAVRLNIADHYHTYWKNPGDAGMPTSIEWELPEGYTVSPIEWPVPAQFNADSMIGFGYEKEAAFLVQVMPPRDIKDKTIDITAKIKWLACSDSTCVPGESDAKATLTVSPDAPELDSKQIPFFSKARLALPNTHEPTKAFHRGGAIEMPLNLPIAEGAQLVSASFFPEDSDVVNHKGETTVIGSEEDEAKYSLALSPAESFKPSEASNKMLRGVIVAKDDREITHIFQVEAPIVAASQDNLISMADLHDKSVAVQSHKLQKSLLVALALAFLGGMILNLMPCVLPVVSFKVLSFVKMAGQRRGLILKHGLAFAGGVLVSFWTLAGALLAMKAYGKSVGWGFQLQEPIFIAILAVILLVLSLSLFGLFEMGMSVASLAGKVQPKQNAGGSFVSGVIATAVATPCTGPFLGSAVGFAVAAPAWAALSVFTFLGLGMAFPYVLMSAFPKLLKFIPKPGPWMNTFKELMGFVMLASVLWLIWVFGAQTNSMALSVLIISFLPIAIACWIYGKWGTPLNSRLSRVISYLLIAAFLCAAGYGVKMSTHPAIAGSSEQIADASADSHWEQFSPERLEELQKEGTPVLIDFTAKWCLICQVNHLVLEQEDVDVKFKEKGVVRMKADWTKNDPVITKELRKHGRSGVPLYVLYDGNKEQPRILPQVLTSEVVIEHLNALDVKTQTSTKDRAMAAS